ncbi:acyloxyacyl hydrolase [Maribacter chungangensis]|uniref:Acyloxyacyl hydrolase n=1 Tax=Maribacter chungangensis TaxID=1069117 RepID=A0ABW3B2U9_9FLAO
MRNIIIAGVILVSGITQAQFVKEKSINVQIGYGLSIPYNSMDTIGDDGFYAQGELVLKITSWFQLRPYAGVVFTNSNGTTLGGKPTNELAESNAFLLGGKFRLRAPIPYVAPYVELGIGTSVGKFQTKTFFDNVTSKGFIYHIPFSIGLELGKNNNVDIGLTYYAQPQIRQFVGAFAFGLSFPLD